MFKKGRTSVTVTENSGHFSTSTSSGKLKAARAMAVQNRKDSTAEVAQKLNVTQASLYPVVYVNLRISKVSARLVLRQLTK
jgi:hypothetical protein